MRLSCGTLSHVLGIHYRCKARIQFNGGKRADATSGQSSGRRPEWENSIRSWAEKSNERVIGSSQDLDFWPHGPKDKRLRS